MRRRDEEPEDDSHWDFMWYWQKQCLHWLNRPGFQHPLPELFASKTCRMHLWGAEGREGLRGMAVLGAKKAPAYSLPPEDQPAPPASRAGKI